MAMRKAICAFREPLPGGSGHCEALYPGQEIDVPDELINRLVADGHIEGPRTSAPQSELALEQESAPRRRRKAADEA